MFVLDTNVISELMSDNPRPTVLAWVDEQRASDLFVTAITEAEIRTGVAILPEGRRRRGLTEATERTFGKLYAGRVLPFGSEAALAYATPSPPLAVLLAGQLPSPIARLRRLPARTARRS